MTQKLKINIKETVDSIEIINTTTAASIMHLEYIKKVDGDYKNKGYLPETLKRNSNYGWSIKKREVIIRPATEDEIKAYHRSELAKNCSLVPCDKVDGLLIGKTVMFEVINE